MIFICYHKEQMLDVEYDILSQKECQLMIDYDSKPAKNSIN